MSFAAVILAAGKGTRMSSDLPKVIHTVGGRPMISLVIDTVKEVPVDHVCVVVGYEAGMVMDVCNGMGVEFVLQEAQLGTGHAVQQCEKALMSFDGEVIVLNGDVPCLRPETIRKFIEDHRRTASSATVLTAMVNDPKGYGRIVRDNDQSLIKIVEEKDASGKERKIREINSGLFCFEKNELFSALGEIGCDNAQNEYYLTDVIAVMKGKGLKVGAYCVDDTMEVAGINTDQELEAVRRYYEAKKK